MNVYITVGFNFLKQGSFYILFFLATTLLRKIWQRIVGTFLKDTRNKNANQVLEIRKKLPRKTLITVIIPTRDGGEYLRNCLNSLQQHLHSVKAEYILIDNGSREADTLKELNYRRKIGWTVLTKDEPFNYSRLNNSAAKLAKGKILCFLNDDVVVEDPYFLKNLAELAIQSGVGAVGPILRYPDGNVQHAGIYLWNRGDAYHLGNGQPVAKLESLNIPIVPHRVTAVTGACLVIESDNFWLVDGFSEEFVVGLNDVDLCLKLTQKGLTNLLDPRTKLIHLESASRGKTPTIDSLTRAISETVLFRKKWKQKYPHDFYSDKSFDFFWKR